MYTKNKKDTPISPDRKAGRGKEKDNEYERDIGRAGCQSSTGHGLHKPRGDDERAGADIILPVPRLALPYVRLGG